MLIHAALLLVTITTVMSNTTCGTNCPSGCEACPCGNVTKYETASTWCSKYPGWKLSSCECIVKAESGANANAVRMNTVGSYNVGLWQIHSLNWAHCSNGVAPCSPDDNLACAVKFFAVGNYTWKEWVTCQQCGVCNSR